MLADVVAEIRSRMDLVDINTVWLNDTTIEQWTLESVGAQWDLLTQIFGDDFYQLTDDQTVSAGTTGEISSIGLPSDFWKLKRVDFLYSGIRYPLTRTALGQRTISDIPISWLPGMNITYRINWAQNLAESQLIFLPPPASAMELRIYYMPSPAISDDTSLFGYEEWVILNVCERIANRLGEDSTNWKQERERYEARMRADAPPKDTANPPVMMKVNDFEPADWVSRFGF